MESERNKQIGPPEALVRAVEGVDLTRARLTATEGFVLSRVDGQSSLQTLCMLTGLGEQLTLEVIAGLRDKGLLVVGDEAPRKPQLVADEPSIQARPQPQQASAAAASPPAAAEAAQGQEGEDEGEDDDDDDDEPCDLKPEIRRKIRGMHRQLGELNIFELLGVPPAAEIKQIRKAFFKQSKIYHPDRYFNKQLGRYSKMLHEIFKQMNAGYRLLCDKTKLDQYRQMVLQQSEQEQLALEVAQEVDQERAGQHRSGPASSQQVDPRAAVQASAPRSPGEYRVNPRRSGIFRVDRTAADTPGRGSSSRQSGERPAGVRPRRRTKLSGAVMLQPQKAQRFYTQGKQQFDRGQYMAATASLKLAVTFAPGETKYRTLYEEASAKARKLSADSFFERGMMEEQANRYDAAVASFVKAAEHRPVARHLAKAAEALMRSRKAPDLLQAQEYATKAVQDDPRSVDARVVAARAYKAAGRKDDARAELEQALKLDPQNEQARELLKGI